MSVTRNMMFNAYSGAVAAVAALVGTRLVTTVWEATTGEPAPDVNNPAVPPAKAFGWVLLNAVGIGMLGVLANRFAAARWQNFSGQDLRRYRNVNLKF